MTKDKDKLRNDINKEIAKLANKYKITKDELKSLIENEYVTRMDAAALDQATGKVFKGKRKSQVKRLESDFGIKKQIIRAHKPEVLEQNIVRNY